MTILPTNRQSKNEDNQSSQPDEAPEEISSSLEDPPPSESLTPSRKRTYNADLFFINTKRLREESSQEEEDEERSNSGDEERCNSEDEYDIKKKLTEDEWRNRDIIFAKSLEKRGFVIKPMIEDGACLFRAIADQVYGDQNKHTVVRKHCMDYILKNRDFFADYITEDFNKYVNRKRHDFVHGNHLEIQALSEMYHRSIEVYSYQLKPINIFHQNSSYEPIRLSYQRASHYNSIVNPFKNTIGVGLGLPENNEDLLIEKAMLEDKLKVTDWEATNEVIEEQVARESYLQWCKDNEKRRKRNSSEGCSSTVTSNDAGGGLTPIGKALDKSGTKLLDTGKKWSQWSPLGAFVSTKNEKKRTLDDSHLDSGEVKFVSLRGHDFTGLGFTICGNMRDGIFIKDVQHRGPAHDSGRLNPGDRIYSVRISFENMVYEDAVAILSSASPYHVEIEAKGSGKNAPGSGGQGQEMGHPVYRSRSSGDLLTIGKSARKGLFQSDHDPSTATDHSTHQLSSNNTTMERGRKSPQTDVNSLTKPERGKKMQTVKNLSPDQLKSQLEQNLAQKISHPGDIHSKQKIETEKQTSEIDNKKGFQKFGVRVLPMESKTENAQQRSPKSSELSQNDNNINQERQLEHSMPEGRDEVDKSKMNGEAPPVKRREKKNGDLPREIPIEIPKETENFVRQNSINGSGIKRDKAGIPQEIPEHMLQAAVAARKNRKSTDVIDKPSDEEADSVKTPKKLKGKAPAPPPGQTKTDTKIDEKPVNKLNFTDNFDEISTLEEKEPKTEKPALINQTDDDMKPETLAEKLDDSKEYCSDSDIETDNQSSVNTIELNSSDITIHHAEQESNDIKGRKTASTGDLSKIQKGRKSNTGTLERAQSLDITDSGIPTLTKKRKATKDDLDSKLSSDESLYEASNLKVKEPRLSLALDGLDTFQRNRLKKSSEWGNLEDVIMNLDKVESEEISSSTDEKISFSDKSPTKFDFGIKDTTFGNTNLNDTNIELVEDEIKEETEKVKNILWPSEEVQEKMEKEIPVPKPQIVDKKDKITTEVTDISTVKVHNVLWPLSDAEKSKENIEQTSHSINIQTTPEKVTNITDSSKREDNVSPKSVSMTDITETSSPPEKITQKPPLPEQSFSLKAQFQEKLNSKLNDTPPSVSTKPQTENAIFHPGKSSQNFIFAEKYASNNDDHYLPSKLYDTNVSDDIKVSRHSLGSLERPKSDVLKSVNKLKMQSLISSDQGGVSNVTITESKPSYENGFTVTENQETKSENAVFDMSTASELYTTAIDSTVKDETIEIKNITISETITDTKYFTDSPSSLTIDTSSDGPDSIKSNTLTYVTEIQVSTPANNKNVSEIEINPDSTHNSPQQSTSEPKSPEENLKKLPEMKFTTSSYETPKTPEKRLSHIELLRSNFEKSPPKPAKPAELSPSKSRIPVATKIDFKTSPERREDTDEKEIVEIMSSAVHSTPIVTNQRFGNPTKTAKNVTVTSIRTSSKIPSGSHSFKPPVPVKPDHTELHENRNGSSESTFKQWVFNPSESSVTNIVVNNNKETHK